MLSSWMTNNPEMCYPVNWILLLRKITSRIKSFVFSWHAILFQLISCRRLEKPIKKDSLLLRAVNFSYPLTNLGVFFPFTISESFVPFWYKMSLISKADLTECNVNLLVVIQPNNTPLPQLVLFRAIIYPLVSQKWHYSWPSELWGLIPFWLHISYI